MALQTIVADYHNPEHADAFVALMQNYAKDPFGGGKALNEQVLRDTITELAKREFAFTLLGFVNDKAVALMNCFELFSTFAGKPLVNIHDIVVAKEFRGQGFSRALLAAVEEIAKSRGCCKLTLEVLSNNRVAKTAYQNFGFSEYQLNPEHGHALYWQKPL